MYTRILDTCRYLELCLTNWCSLQQPHVDGLSGSITINTRLLRSDCSPETGASPAQPSPAQPSLEMDYCQIRGN